MDVVAADPGKDIAAPHFVDGSPPLVRSIRTPDGRWELEHLVTGEVHSLQPPGAPWRLEHSGGYGYVEADGISESHWVNDLLLATLFSAGGRLYVQTCRFQGDLHYSPEASS